MRLQLGNGCGSDAILKVEEGPRQLAILGRWGPKQTGRRNRTGWKGESDKGQENKRIRRAKGLGEPGAMEDEKGWRQQNFYFKNYYK